MTSYFSKTIRVILTASVVITMVLSWVMYVDAATITDLMNQKNALSSEIAKNRAIAEQKKKEAADLNGQVAALQTDIDEAQVKINSTQSNINTVQGQVDDLKQKIVDKQSELLSEQQKLNAALVEIYTASHRSTWQLVLSTSTLSEALNRNKYLEALQARISQSINEISKIKADLESERAQMEKKQQELVSLRRQQQVYQQGVENQQNQKNLLMKDAKAAQSVAEQKIAEAQKVYANVNSELYRLQEMTKRRAATRPPGSRVVTNITWVWPLGGPLTTYFNGSTPFQPTGGHGGIDIANVYGSPIASAANGTVTFAGSSTGYGSNVRVDHGGGYTTLYGHMSEFAVSVGQTVNAGQTIGYVGMTGWTTGPHLHFEIRANGAPDDPLAYLP